MKQITISKQALNILYNNLESNPKGFSRKELRQMDKIIIEIFDPFMSDFRNNLEKLLQEAKKKTEENPKDASLISEKFNILIENLFNTQGKEKVNLKLEDADFDFLKNYWDKQDNFSGVKKTRQLIFEIENSLNHAEPIIKKNP
jgi:hypothetical protein